MAIVQTCDFHDVQAAFERMNRQDNFSPSGLRVLFDYLDNLGDAIGQPVELDVVAWCCEYRESTIDEIVQDYSLEEDVEGLDDDEKRDFVESYLQDNTILCGKTADGFVCQVF